MQRSGLLFLYTLLSFLSLHAQKKGAIKEIMKSVADWQMAHPAHTATNWTNGALYVGMVRQAQLSEDDTYWRYLKNIAATQQWKPGVNTFHADDLCVGQLYCELFLKYKNEAILEPTIERLDSIIAAGKTVPLDFNLPGNQQRWSWCDALFMAPTVFARAGEITGDKKYVDFMDKEFWVTYDTLFNTTDALFYRDTRYKTKREANGSNVYWARGNGWVIGGLTIIIDHLPKGHPSRQRYIDLYKRMITRIAALQDSNGFWHPSLLDYTTYPMQETSSSGFFTYGIAWGINRGILKKRTFLPAAKKGWNALISAVQPDGKLGWVQAIGADPTKVSKDDTEVYGIGAFLLAGAEMYRLAK